MAFRPAAAVVGVLSLVVVTVPGCVFVDPATSRNDWTSQGYSCTFLTSARLRQLDRESVTVSVYDAQKRPLSGAIVSLDLSMPSMSMPKNSITLPKIEDGLYRGDVRFTMAGQWNVRVAVTIDGKVITDHLVPVTVH
jgi:nitrogen fixation protein FixH